MPEFDLIRRLQQIICITPQRETAQCVVGIGDDGAVLNLPSDRDLVVCTDTLVSGVHFPVSTRPAAIGHKALAVNLSDLAAMGAEPAWFFMALTLPSEDSAWLDAFAGGMAELAATARIELAGGDVTAGPLSITITALGQIEKGRSLLRSGAVEGDLVVVSGTPGAAAHALSKLNKGENPSSADLSALDFPVPRLELGRALRDYATSCIDISDGLAADLGHILEQSGVGAEVDPGRLPCPASLESMTPEERWPLQLAGGDDYELCFTVPAESESSLAILAEDCKVKLTVIGEITRDTDLKLKTVEGVLYEPVMKGYSHFDHQDLENL